MKFDDYRIAPELKRNLATLEWRRPTDIQFKAIPHILQGEDVLAVAQTGTGKTAAFAIPTIHLLHVRKQSRRAAGVKALVMVPTHELAIQLTQVFQTLAKHTNTICYGIYGGVEQDPQIAQLNKGVDILIATPGRMFDLHSQGHLSLDQVEILILDEADHMLDEGFLKDIQQLTRKLPRRRQTLFFSATIDEDIKQLAYSLVNNAIRIQISPKDPVAKNISHAVAYVEMDDKRFFLERFLNEHPEDKVLVFVRTKLRAERVTKALERMGIASLNIHGDKEQTLRRSVMQAFRSGEQRVLVATDVSARGVDIPDVAFVINYDLPEQTENYVHRVGRTGRGNRRGQAISFCSEQELPLLQRIEAYLEQPIARLTVDPETYEETLALSEDQSSDWRKLMQEAESEHQAAKTKRSPKRKKKKR